jgi:RNA polymerase sigma-70 factor (ECF subfamily)
MPESDAECVSAYKAGNNSALETLYWRHAERVWRYAHYFSGSDDAASEIVQETFVRVAQHLRSFEGRAQFSTWLFAIVRSVAIDQTTKRRRAPAATEAETMEQVPASTPGPAEKLDDAETRAAVRAAIARLPENEREAVLLCEIEDLPLRTAGEILGWGEGRVKVTLFRARRRLKELLAPHVGATRGS